MPQQTMRAIRVHDYGGPEQLKLEETPRPEPQAGEVLLRVHAAGVNPIDWKLRQGRMRTIAPTTFPYTPGIEASGVVEAVGDGVTAFQMGQAVFGRCANGAYAEYVAIPADDLVLKPASVTFAEAATIAVGATTAWRALFEHGGLTQGQRVFIQGAAGGVGLFAVQLAKWKGAEVIATASPANLDFVRGLGAETVIDYTTTPVERLVPDADLALDGVGGEALNSSLAMVHPGGTLISIAGPPPEGAAQARGIRALMIRTPPSGAILREITALIAQGHLKAIAGRAFPLSAAREAHAYGERGGGRGRIVLTVE